jgi:hypothetical protein
MLQMPSGKTLPWALDMTLGEQVNNQLAGIEIPRMMSVV